VELRDQAPTAPLIRTAPTGQPPVQQNLRRLLRDRGASLNDCAGADIAGDGAGKGKRIVWDAKAELVAYKGEISFEVQAEVVAALSFTDTKSSAKRGTRLQRYYRDVAMYHGHIASQYLSTAGDLARVHFGLPDSLF